MTEYARRSDIAWLVCSRLKLGMATAAGIIGYMLITSLLQFRFIAQIADFVLQFLADWEEDHAHPAA